MGYPTLDALIAAEAISFSLDDADAAIDTIVTSFGNVVDLLGLGEPTHGGEQFLMLRNRLFRRLVEAHGYTAIAIESSFPRGQLVDALIADRTGADYAAIADRGFSHNFGRTAATRELIEWMRDHNRTAATKLHFYGFDAPTEISGADSPRQSLMLAIDYLVGIDAPAAAVHRERVTPLLGDDAAWLNPNAMMDPTQSIGGSAEAIALRAATEDLIGELSVRRPELVAASDSARFLTALQNAIGARQLLTYHAAMARPAANRLSTQLGLRDATMADHLEHAVQIERARGGKVFVYAHNSHLQRSRGFWQWGPNRMEWWPAGAQIHERLGDRYAVIGTGVGTMELRFGEHEFQIAAPEPDTIEAEMLKTPGPIRVVPTGRGSRLATEVIHALPTRSGHRVYFPFTPQSVRDFDALAVVDAVTPQRPL